MTELLDVDGAAYRVLRRWYAWWFLGLLWLVCCVPLVTVPAATRAGYVAVRRLRAHDVLPAAGTFARDLRAGFRTATLSGLVLAGAGAVLLADLALAARARPAVAAIGLCVFVPLCLGWCMTAAVHGAVLAADTRTGPVAALRASYVAASTRPLQAMAAVAAVAAACAVAVISPPVLQPVAALTVVGAAFDLSFVLVRTTSSRPERTAGSTA